MRVEDEGFRGRQRGKHRREGRRLGWFYQPSAFASAKGGGGNKVT